MSDVYLGVHRELSRPFAVKVSRPNMDQEKTYRSRFSREIGLHAKVASGHVTQFHSAGRIGERKFIVMEYVEGCSLGKFILRNTRAHRSISIDHLLTISTQLAHGIHAIANAGIVHRDLKPENILLRKDGVVKITDFGIATYLENDSFTDINTTLGTVGYMSPEQWNGHYLDVRSDIYSFGIVLFEMLTNTGLSFRQENDIAFHPNFQMKAHVLRNARPDAPRALLNLVEKCLRSDRRLRFQDSKSLIAALMALRSPAASASPKKQPAHTVSFIPEALILLLVVLLIVAYAMSSAG
jgi:serine/threonine-protein kinase